MANLELKAIITAEDKASSTIQKVGGSFASLASKGLAVAAKASLALGAGLVAASGFAVKSAADVQMLRTNLDTLTGSAEKGSRMFSDLYKMAAKTPFETPELANAAQMLLSYGVTQEKIIDNLKMLGDVSMGNKVKFQGLSYAFSQVQATGRLMGQDLMQMVNQGFNPLQIISEKTGKSMAVLKGEMEKGKISAQMVTDAMITATSAGGRFYQGMDKGSRTLQGTWSTLMDSIGMLSRKMVGLSETGDVVKGGLFDKIATGVQNLNTWIENNQETIDRYAQVITTVLTVSINGLSTAVSTLVNWLIETKNKIVEYFTTTQTGLTILYTFQGLIMGIINQAKILWKTIQENKDMFIEIGKVIAFVVGTAFAMLLAAIQAIIWMLDKAIKTMAFFRDINIAIVDAIKNVWSALTNYIKGQMNAAISMANKVISGLNRVPGVNIKTIPSFQSGGIMPHEGLAYLHKGERIIPSSMTTTNSMNVNIYGNINNQQGLSPEEIGGIINRQVQLSRQGAY